MMKENILHKIKFKNWVSVFVSYKVILWIKKFSKGKERYWLLVKGLIYQWDIVILNVPLHQQQNFSIHGAKMEQMDRTERRNKKIHNYSWEIQSSRFFEWKEEIDKNKYNRISEKCY